MVADSTRTARFITSIHTWIKQKKLAYTSSYISSPGSQTTYPAPHSYPTYIRQRVRTITEVSRRLFRFIQSRYWSFISTRLVESCSLPLCQTSAASVVPTLAVIQHSATTNMAIPGKLFCYIILGYVYFFLLQIKPSAVTTCNCCFPIRPFFVFPGPKGTY